MAISFFEDASFGVQEGDKIGIVGINGTGKSTLLKMIAGEEEPDEGQIIRQNGKKAAYLLQNPVFCADSDIAGYALDGNPDTDWKVQSNLTKLGILDYTAKMADFPADRGERWRWRKCWPKMWIFCFWTSRPTIWMRE